MAYALELEHVGKSYDKFKLDDVSFKLEEGLIMGLIGTNGAGKTTLIQTILGLLKHTGTVKVFGMDIDEFEKETKDLCGFILDENPYLNSVTPIGNARIFGPHYSGWNEEKFIAYCKKFDVNLKRPLMKLSKGTVTKFQLAFALSHNAKLLIFDEPSSGLDPIFRREFIDIMYDIIIDGERSILFSTHLTNELDRIADYIVMLHKGEQLFAMPKDELLDSYQLIRGKRQEIESIANDLIAGKRHMETYSEALVLSKGLQLSQGLNIIRPTIEDIMFYLVKK